MMNHLISYFLKDTLDLSRAKMLLGDGNCVVLWPRTLSLSFPRKVCGRYSHEFYEIMPIVDYNSVNGDILFASV